MTPQEHEQYEWILEKSFDAEHPMPRRLVELHELAYSVGRRVGLTSVPKSTMICLAIMAGCFEKRQVADDAANVKLAKTVELPKRRPGRPTNKEREERAFAEKQAAGVT